MNRTSIAAITSVLILILIGCGGKSTNDAESPGSEVSKTNVNIDSSDAKANEDDAKTNNVIQISAGKTSSSKNPDSLIKYNGKDFSVLSDAETILSDLVTMTQNFLVSMMNIRIMSFPQQRFNLIQQLLTERRLQYFSTSTTLILRHPKMSVWEIQNRTYLMHTDFLTQQIRTILPTRSNTIFLHLI